MSRLQANFDQVCNCCGKRLIAWYKFDPKTNTAFIGGTSKSCACDAGFSPAGSSPSLYEWENTMKRKMANRKPFVVDFAVTYKKSIVVWSEDAFQAREDAYDLYEEGDFDPVECGDNDYDIRSYHASPEQEEKYRYDTFLFDGCSDDDDDDDDRYYYVEDDDDDEEDDDEEDE